LSAEQIGDDLVGVAGIGLRNQANRRWRCWRDTPPWGHHTICTKLHAKPNLDRQAAFRKRSFKKRDKLDDNSWDFLFQSPLSKSSSKANGM
jgi:hypothetical protein